MTTETDLRLAYRELVRQALSRDELLLTMRPNVRQSWRRRMFLPILGAALATIAAVLAVLVVVRARANRHSGPAGPGAPLAFPTEYWFGPASLPGYPLTSVGLVRGRPVRHLPSDRRPRDGHICDAHWHPTHPAAASRDHRAYTGAGRRREWSLRRVERRRPRAHRTSSLLAARRESLDRHHQVL